MKLLVKELSIVTMTAILSMGLTGCGSGESDRFDDPNAQSSLQNEFKASEDNDGDGLTTDKKILMVTKNLMMARPISIIKILMVMVCGMVMRLIFILLIH